MSVILGSEIARLVFGYLQEEQLEEAATVFCKTCPFLVEEYDWLQRGYRACKINDLCLVDIIREHCEIKYAVSEYIESLPLSVGETLKLQKSLSGKINSIFDLLSSSQSRPNTSARKRPYSMIGSNSTEATQSNELPGYEPALKERRLSRKLILRRDCTPKSSSTWIPTLKQNAQDVYVSDDQDEENTSPQQGSNLEKSRHETSQYPIFTETILENTQFQNVLVENINRILENSSDRMEVSAESGSQLNESNPNNNSLQEQVKHALDNIILSTERDPTFQQVLDDVLQHKSQEQTTRTALGTNDDEDNSDEKSDSPVPLKQRLRNRSQDKPRPNYNEIDQNSKKKRKAKVEVISNEIVSGEIRDLLHPTTTIRTDNYVPYNQILYLNSDRTTGSTFSQDPVYVNVGVPSFPLIRIDADTPMYLNDISMLNNGTSTSLAPGSIINIPSVEQLGQPIQSMLPNVIIKDIVEENRTKHVQSRSGKSTPNASKNMVQAKSRSLTTPRRQSHVRSLNFTTSDDVINENERLTDKRNDDTKRSETVLRSSLSKSPVMRNNETDNTNQKTSLEEVEPQQDSSDAVDVSKEFDEATVISVELSPMEGPTKLESSKEEKPVGSASEKKKPQTRRQSQRDLEMWKQMRRMNKGEWDNYLRQTVASNADNAPVEKKKIKKRKPRNTAKAVEKMEEKADDKPDEMNVSTESANNSTTDIQARLLEEALESAKKPVSPVIKNKSTSEAASMESAKETNISEPSKPHSPSVPSGQGSSVKSQRSPNKRSSGRNQLIKIKLPASAKKKFTKSKRRRIKPGVKRSFISTDKSEEKPPAQAQKRCAETTQIDPEQSVDIDLISPIEHPKELNYVVKSNVNLNSFLETPCKESASFKFPITPGLAVPSSLKTPGVRLVKMDYDSSLIKFPEYPTPSFPITPGCSKTPLSQTSSQKDGSSYNRATDYSSGSSYYKPDESDDIDKNIDVIIKENRAHMNIGGLGVDPQQNIKLGNDEPLSDAEFSDSSKNSSYSSSSDSSSSSESTSSSSPTSAVDTSVKKEVLDAKNLLMAQRTQNLLKMEQVRLRTLATLKSDKKIERFRKPKPKISTLHRQKVIENSLKKSAQTLKMSGNSTPKVVAKAVPKHVTKPAVKLQVKPNQKTTNTPSKRKIATPRRVIYWDNNEPLKTSSRTSSHERKSRQAEQLMSEPNDNATFKPVEESKQLRPPTPTETIDAIENHIATTSQTSFEECVYKSKIDSQVDTPNLIQQLQGKGDVNNKVVPPEMGPPASLSKSALVRELFGDGTMSDSDFMDTPVKIPIDSRNQAKNVPISHATDEISKNSFNKDSTSKFSTAKESTSKDSIPMASIAKDSISKDSIAKISTGRTSSSKDLNVKNYNAKDSNTKDSNAKGSNAEDSSTKDSSAKDSCARDSSTKDSSTKDSSATDSNANHSNSKDSSSEASSAKASNTKETSAKETSAKETSSKETSSKETSSKETNSKETNSKETSSKETSAKASKTKETSAKNSSSKHSNAKDICVKDSVDKNTVAKDSIAKNSSANESCTKHTILKDVNTNDSIDKDVVINMEKDSTAKDSISKQSIVKDSIKKDPNVANPSSTTSVALFKQSKSTAVDPNSETDDDGYDEDDDYDDCIMIFANHRGMSNRIYHHVTSDTKECKTEVNRQCINLRPLTTFLNGRKIVMNTCDELILYNSAPKTSSSGGSKKLISNRKTIKIVQSAKNKVDTDQKLHKVSSDKTDSSVNPNDHVSITPEKHFRFKLVAKHKGPVDASSSQMSSSRDIPRKILLQSEESQQNAGTSNQMKKSSSLHTKIPPLLKDMDINKVLGKIHPSNEIA